jgi:hypothetical protein
VSTPKFMNAILFPDDPNVFFADDELLARIRAAIPADRTLDVLPLPAPKGIPGSSSPLRVSGAGSRFDRIRQKEPKTEQEQAQIKRMTAIFNRK